MTQQLQVSVWEDELGSSLDAEGVVTAKTGSDKRGCPRLAWQYGWIGAAAVAVVLLSGCMTMSTRSADLDHGESMPRYVYPGTQVDLALLAHPLDNYPRPGAEIFSLVFFGLALVDFPFSLVADTLLLPYDLWMVTLGGRGRRRSELHLTARGKDPEAVSALIAKGLNVNARDPDGATPLHFASAGAGRSEIVALLLAAGANPNIRDKRGKRPIDLTTNREIAERLMAGGSRLEFPEAVRFGTADQVKAFLQSDRSLALNVPKNFGCTPLHLACIEGRKDIAEILIAHGADVNARAQRSGLDVSTGAAPLACAVETDSAEVVELLLAQGADADAEAVLDATLSALASEKQGMIAEMLLAALKGDDHTARVAAAEALGKLGKLAPPRQKRRVSSAHEIPMHRLSNAGMATPAAALQTLLWAARNHDLDNFVNCLAPRLQKSFETDMRADPHRPEKVMLTLSRELKPGATLLIDSTTFVGEDFAEIKYGVKQPSQNMMLVQCRYWILVGSEWKFIY